MTQSEAANIAREMTRFLTAENGRSGDDRVSSLVHGAVFEQAYEFIPDGAAAALIQRDEDNEAIVVAFHGQHLYLLEILDYEPELSQPPTLCRMIYVAPGSGTVEVETRYRRRGGGATPRSATWRFGFPEGVTLTIETHVDLDGEADDRELLSRAIAGGLGWSRAGAAPEIQIEAL